MSVYDFANGYLAFLGASQLAADTTLMPDSGVGAPVVDPTADQPRQFVLLVDYDFETGRRTANTEVQLVIDSRTTPWQVIRASEAVVGGVAQGAPIDHPAGAPIALIASAEALRSLVNPDVTSLGGTGGWPGNPGDVLTVTPSGVVMPQPPTVPSLAVGVARNSSGVPDPQSAISGTPFLFGPPVPVTDGVGNALTVGVQAGVGRDVELTVSIPMVRDGNSDTGLFLLLQIFETTPAADLVTAGLNALNFQSGWIPVPATPNAQFRAATENHWVPAAETVIDRQWSPLYQLLNPTGASGASGHWVQNLNTADAFFLLVVARSLTSNVVTLTTASPHFFHVGDAITVANVGTSFNGNFTVASVPTATTLTYAKTAANVANAASGGTVTANPPSAARLPTPRTRSGSRLAAILH